MRLVVKIPREIKIATHTYDTKITSTLNHDIGALGVARHRKQVIELDSLMAISTRNQVFIHEVLHIIERVYGIHWDESDVDRVAEGIAELLFNNLNIEFDWELIEGLGQSPILTPEKIHH